MAFVTKLHAVVQELHAHTTIVLFGGAAEGLSTYQFLRTILPDTPITLVDDKPITELSDIVQNALSTDPAFFFSLPDKLVLNDSSSYILYKTPGIPRSHPFFTRLALETKSVTYTSNANLFLHLIAAIPLEDRPFTIGVTGTKGKSTTAAVLAHILHTVGKQVILGGNIGVPVLDLMEKLFFYALHELHDVFIVLELSSHQILDLETSPHLAILQDITPEHLDYYASFEEYWRAKARLVAFQEPTDFLLYNPACPIPARIAQDTPAQKIVFSLASYPGQLVKVTEENITTSSGEMIIQIAELPLVGTHNIVNILPGLTLACMLHLPIPKVREALVTFTPLPHRLNFVRTVNEVKYFNDSQATTPEATCAALASFTDTGVVLIAGGSDKGVTFEIVAKQILSQTVRALILFPPMGALIEQTLKDQALQQPDKHMPHCTTVLTMQEAVSEAQKFAQPGDVVLLSPACASFGIFKNYKDRGEQFVVQVREIAATKP